MNQENDLIDNILPCLKNNDLKCIGRNLIKNQEYLETIGVSNEKLRNMIEIATKYSFGAKITGAGGGGCIFALTDENNMKKTIHQLQENDNDCFSVKIDFQGLDTF